MLRGVNWKFVTEVSWRPVGPLALQDWTHGLSRNACDTTNLRCVTCQKNKGHIYTGGSPESRIIAQTLFCVLSYIIILFGTTAPPPQGAMVSSFLRFLDHTQRRTTVGRTPLDEWSAHRRDLYLKTHNTHNRQTSMPPVGFEPTISAGERPQTYALDRTATGTGSYIITTPKYRPVQRLASKFTQNCGKWPLA